MKYGRLVLFFIGTLNLSAQWSTSNKTQDALFACPGFYSDIVTYPDGSSIIIGIGDNNEIWMQKLNQYGYKQWLPYITVFPAINGSRYFLPDDDGGIYAIVGSVCQRINRNGDLRWGEAGKTIIPLGNISSAVTDGRNGFLAVYNFYDGSKQRVNMLRYDSIGTKLWEILIDSSIAQNSIDAKVVGRLAEKTLIYSSKAKDKIVNLEGIISNADSTFLRSDYFIKESDSSGFNVQVLSFQSDSLGYLITDRIIKLNNDWDTVWASVIKFREIPAKYINAGDPFLHDGLGNLFRYISYFDDGDTGYTRIDQLSKEGIAKQALIKGIAGRFFFRANGKIGFISDSMFAQSLDSLFNPQWPNHFSIIADPFDAYVKHVTTDNNGGAIISFWTVAGGIRVQHTGRIGKLGVLTKIFDGKLVPLTFELFQNYPNPFNSSTTIEFTILENNQIELKIFDLLGREIKTVLSEKVTKGRYSISIDMNTVASGTYFYRLKSGKNILTRKMALLK